jgi:penicillin-insensitive murein endopeptidase
MRQVIGILSVLAVPSVAGAALDARVWATHRSPAPGVAQAIGAFSEGCVQGADRLSSDGKGYQVMRLSRGRTYGHPDLIRFIEKLGARSQESKLGTLLIGDLGLPRGGWMQSGHSSHQSGLDVDVWYDFHPVAQKRKLTPRERERISAQNLVPKSYQKGLNRKAFTQKTVDLLALAASFSEVDRIFVNAAIKSELCRRTANGTTAPWLRKIRPWYAHADHMHVRLSCPEGSPKCRPQDRLPEGPGCDETLEWWFTAEPREEAKKAALKARQNPGPPAVPEECVPLAVSGV